MLLLSLHSSWPRRLVLLVKVHPASHVLSQYHRLPVTRTQTHTHARTHGHTLLCLYQDRKHLRLSGDCMVLWRCVSVQSSFTMWFIHCQRRSDHLRYDTSLPESLIGQQYPGQTRITVEFPISSLLFLPSLLLYFSLGSSCLQSVSGCGPALWEPCFVGHGLPVSLCLVSLPSCRSPNIPVTVFMFSCHLLLSYHPLTASAARDSRRDL